MDKPTIFISYSHKDEIWKDRLRPHLGALEKAGRIVVWDDRKIDAGDTWYPEIKTAMEQAAVAVCLISADFLDSAFCVKEEVPYFLQRRERDGLVIIPVLLRPCPWRAIDWLKDLQMLPRDYKSVSADFKDDWDTVFALVAERVFEIINNPDYKPPAPPAPAWAKPEKLDISRLPVTGSELFGRQAQLELLDEAWDSATTNVVSFVAWGGVGKSTLVNKWLERLAKDNYRGAERVYAWSFYSQGTTERATSADLFIHSALEWFGDEDPTAGSPWDKGERLAQLIRKNRTLLLLDGMEPLQSSNSFERGKIKDPALATLVTELARENPGLCVITTREHISDLDTRYGTGSGSDWVLAILNPSAARGANAVQQINLELLSPEAGRALLRFGGVRGTDEELERAAESFGCHALALSLLAVYLQDIPGHHVSAAEQIPDLDIPEAEGKHPRRMIAAFERKLGNGAETEVLRMLGLFDRPADGASLAALRKAPKIPGLTDHIGEDAEAAWLRAVQKLRKLKLIAAESHHDPEELDAHPLVREHFGQQMKRDHPDAWRAANLLLYEHLTTTTKELPDTVEEMSPLFAAVAHGCQAGKYREVLHEVCYERIARKEQYFSARNLGAFGSNLAVLSNFFVEPWQPVAELSADERLAVMGIVSWCLQALGRTVEAAQVKQAVLDDAISKGNWKTAAYESGYLSELYLTLGDLARAQSLAQQCVEFADRSNDSLLQIRNRTILADAMVQAGRLQDAEDTFRNAEETQRSKEPELPFLYSMPGFRYCDLLLSKGCFQEVQERAAQTLEGAKQSGSLLSIALDNLSLGRAWLLQARQEDGEILRAANFLKHAVDGLRQAGRLDILPIGLLMRAELHRLTGGYTHAQTDLEEAHRIANRGQMGLHLADCHLERARLWLALGKGDTAREHWATVKAMIEGMGYHRRDGEVAELSEALGMSKAE